MPISNLLHLPAVIHLAGAIRPTRILDVGVGMGTYGFLLRQFLDIGQERVNRDEWKISIDGIEIFEGYRNPVWSYAYNSVRIGDARILLNELPEYDVILCNDVLEHFEKSEAVALLEKLLNKGRVVISTTPNQEFPQGAWGGNEAERHRCLLRREDFPHLVAWRGTGVTNCYVCCKRTQDIAIMLGAAAFCPICRPKPLPMLLARLKGAFRRIGKVLSK